MRMQLAHREGRVVVRWTASVRRSYIEHDCRRRSLLGRPLSAVTSRRRIAPRAANRTPFVAVSTTPVVTTAKSPPLLGAGLSRIDAVHRRHALALSCRPAAEAMQITPAHRTAGVGNDSTTERLAAAVISWSSAVSAVSDGSWPSSRTCGGSGVVQLATFLQADSQTPISPSAMTSRPSNQSCVCDACCAQVVVVDEMRASRSLCNLGPKRIIGLRRVRCPVMADSDDRTRTAGNFSRHASTNLTLVAYHKASVNLPADWEFLAYHSQKVASETTNTRSTVNRI